MLSILNVVRSEIKRYTRPYSLLIGLELGAHIDFGFGCWVGRQLATGPPPVTFILIMVTWYTILSTSHSSFPFNYR